ncbi:MAG: hypothetical protein KJ970_20875 [Candidatus Eisenbacteria bacterium]|uniref:Right-handed parallel beta-helix repeat-containing protein n=1 Tax=Eiseniibacteriota bacterium TaxID=2212470 RepID=A0A948RZQ5_UNCEI|nr:hypothetical protein [Candidatus Eisenbacteria bacterium]MBU1947430.1 hypothetical protein [Candidatus Eisenbacteria bacterium]MBU2693381.1 hypothetical protein [Candidatus Eisenbacteria bacterium]
MLIRRNIHRAMIGLLAAAALIPSMGGATTLQEAYETAGPASGYDKYIELESGRIYTGSLMIGPSLVPYTGILAGGPGRDVRIIGNGAIIDLQGGQLCISYCENRLDIDDCVVINGSIKFRGLTGIVNILPTGSVRHVTMFKPHDYGIRLQRAGAGITIERNLVVSAVDTGNDFIYTTGISMEWLPTGTNISTGWAAGWADIVDNWSYHIDPEDNDEMLAHFSFL